MQAVDKYYMGIPPNHWLPWIPQLLTCLIRQEGSHILNLLCSVGKTYPQAVYFPIRTLYLTLKVEQREKRKYSLNQFSFHLHVIVCHSPLFIPNNPCIIMTLTFYIKFYYKYLFVFHSHSLFHILIDRHNPILHSIYSPFVFLFRQS